MKTICACLCAFFLCVTVLPSEDKYLVVFQSEKATTHDKIALRDALFRVLNDRTKLDWDSLVRWATTNTPSVTGRVVVITLDNPRKMTKADMSELTLAKLNTWKELNLDAPAKTRFDIGESWLSIQASNGMITVVSTNTP